MPHYAFGDIVVAEYPFADELKSKRRPALVLSESSDNDFILLRITTKIRHTEMDVLLHDWESAGLRAPSVVRLDKPTTSNLTYILRPMGKVSKTDALRILTGLRKSCEVIARTIQAEVK